jgi:hypothetical protein
VQERLLRNRHAIKIIVQVGRAPRCAVILCIYQIAPAGGCAPPGPMSDSDARGNKLLG